MTSNNINSNDGGASATATYFPPSHLYGNNSDYFCHNTMYRPPSFPSAHGKKRALLCGVSYRMCRNELQGSVNDVNCIKYLLTAKLGFSNDSVLVLTGEEGKTSAAATMGDRRERCNGCGIELIMPGKAKAIKCAVCGAVTKVQNQRIQAHEKVQQAAELVKGLTKAIFYGMTSNNINSYDGGASATATYSPPSHLYRNNSDYFRRNMMYRPPSFPSAHGKKRALLYGVSYRRRMNELQGSVNDVNCIKYLLTSKLGFSNDSILVLTGTLPQTTSL